MCRLPALGHVSPPFLLPESSRQLSCEPGLGFRLRLEFRQCSFNPLFLTLTVIR